MLASVMALVFAVGHVLGGSGAKTPTGRAQTTGGTVTPSAPVVPVVPAQVGPVVPKVGATAAGGSAPVSQVAPDGPCQLSDITAVPVAGTAPAGRGVPLVVALTGIRPACTLQISSTSLVVKVDQGTAKVWSSQDCPSSVTATSVVVRSTAPTTVQVTWNGRVSDNTCSRSTDWALPGAYDVTAAVIGSEPSHAAVKLTAPPRPIVIRTIAPKPPKTPKKHQKSSAATPPDTGHRRMANGG